MNDAVLTLAFVIGGFLCGALPFSVWIGHYGLRKDIRHYGDGNPGTFNVMRAGGIQWGVLALLADIGKGALPVGLAAQTFHIDGWGLVAAGIAPILGHAFSPFLGFKGGKAIATSGGVWIGLTLGTAFLVGVVMLVYWYLAVTVSGWAVMLTSVSLLLHLLLIGAGWVLLVIWTLNAALFAYKHRDDLRKPLRLKVSPLFKPVFRNLTLS